MKFSQAQNVQLPSLAAKRTGREAYMRYGMAVVACVEAVGGKAHFCGMVTDLMLGHVEELRDMVAIAEHPSRAAMLAMVQSSDYQAIEVHRMAGLACQLNICTKMIGG